MTGLPRYWWLLALACAGQGAYFLRPELLRGARRRAPAWALAGLAGGGAFGLAYAVVQSDAVFLAGQAAVLLAVLLPALRDRARGGR